MQYPYFVALDTDGNVSLKVSPEEKYRTVNIGCGWTWFAGVEMNQDGLYRILAPRLSQEINEHGVPVPVPGEIANILRAEGIAISEGDIES